MPLVRRLPVSPDNPNRAVGVVATALDALNAWRASGADSYGAAAKAIDAAIDAARDMDDATAVEQVAAAIVEVVQRAF